jgi:hypothetical protein
MYTVNNSNAYKKRCRRSEFEAEMYSWFIQRRGETIAYPFSVRKQYVFALKTLLAPFDVEIDLHRP